MLLSIRLKNNKKILLHKSVLNSKNLGNLRKLPYKLYNEPFYTNNNKNYFMDSSIINNEYFGKNYYNAPLNQAHKLENSPLKSNNIENEIMQNINNNFNLNTAYNQPNINNSCYQSYIDNTGNTIEINACDTNAIGKSFKKRNINKLNGIFDVKFCDYVAKFDGQTILDENDYSKREHAFFTLSLHMLNYFKNKNSSEFVKSILLTDIISIPKIITGTANSCIKFESNSYNTNNKLHDKIIVCLNNQKEAYALINAFSIYLKCRVGNNNLSNNLDTSFNNYVLKNNNYYNNINSQLNNKIQNNSDKLIMNNTYYVPGSKVLFSSIK